jgi:hypothetical protein
MKQPRRVNPRAGNSPIPAKKPAETKASSMSRSGYGMAAPNLSRWKETLMDAGSILGDTSKNRALELLVYFVVVAVAFGGGMALESHLDAQTAALVKLTYEQDLKQAHEKADDQKRAFTDTILKERDDHAKVIQAKDANLAAVAKHATGMRTALESDLSAARSSGEACSARIAGISEALGGVFDSIGEVAVIAQNLGRENQQLAASNKSLTAKLVGWQKWNSERTQRIVVTAQKNG